MDITPKVKATKAKINKWDYSKLKSFCTEKVTVNKMKRQPTKWEKVFVNHVSETGQISKICNELIQLRIMDCVIYYCFANHPNTLWIKITILIMSEFIWVRNSGATLCANYQRGLQSFQDLISAPEYASQMCITWPANGGGLSDLPCSTLLGAAEYFHDFATHLLWSKWSKREQGGTCHDFND